MSARAFRLALFALVPALSACPKGGDAAGDRVKVEEVQSVLVERERKVHSYRIEGTVSEAGQTAAFRFAHRAPNRMLAELKGETPRTFAFDGERLMELSPKESRVQIFDLGGKPEEVAVQLHQIFQSFVPDGFRTPVIDWSKASARKVSHPLAPQALELSSEVQDPSGLVRAEYVLRWPSGDLVERRLVYGEQKMVMKIAREHCDDRLKLCVPSRLEQTVNGTPGAIVDLTSVELNATLPKDAFTPAVPEGWSVDRKPLLPQEG